MFSFDCERTLNTFFARDRDNESGNQFESSVHSVSTFADPSNVGRISSWRWQGIICWIKQGLNWWSKNIRWDLLTAVSMSFSNKPTFKDNHRFFLNLEENNLDFRCEMFTRWETWSELKNYKSTNSLHKIERKSWDITKAHFTNAGNARKDEFYEWFRGISRSRVESQWEVVSRFQSTSSDSKFSFSAEPRQLTQGIRLNHRKTFLVIVFSSFDPSQNHHQEIHQCRKPTSDWDRDLFRKRWRANWGHNSNADICKKTVDHEFIISGGYSAFYGWTAKTADIGTAIRQVLCTFLISLLED